MTGHRLFGLMLGLVLACPSMVLAMEHQPGAKYTLSMTKNYVPSAWTAQEHYMTRASHKLLFGGKNTLMGWMELYKEPRESMQEDQGFMRGMGRGLVNMLGDTLGGVVHLCTFPLTMVDVALPEGGV